jgi:phosphoserine aminotransferase
MKINNFSAGPSKIPYDVLQNISEDIIDYKDLGYSVLELSHRSDIFKVKLLKFLIFLMISK